MQLVLAQLELAAPQRLIALGVMLLILLASWFAASRHSRGRRAAMTACRVFAIAALVLAWAGLAWRGPTSRTFVVLLEDCSDSMNDQRQKKLSYPNEDALLLFAGGTNSAAAALSPGSTPFVERAKLVPLESDPALAVTRAAALIPDGYVGHIVLKTDGRATRDGLLEAAVAQGMPVHAVVAPAFPAPEVCVDGVAAPLIAQPLTPFDFDVVVTSNHADSGRLELRIGDTAPQTRDVKLTPGDNRFKFSATLDIAQPSLLLRATLSGFQDTYAANNTRRAVVTAAPKPRLLLVTEAADRAGKLAAALTPLGFEIETAQPARLPVGRNALARYDAILLSGVSPKSMPEAQQKTIDSFVRDGGGLLVCGGEAMLGPRSLAGSWLERMLPLTAAHERQQRKPTLALVMIIDRSESMLEQRRLELAKEAARRTVGLDVIGPADQVGVLVFGDQSEWISPLAPCGDKQRLLAAIDTLKAEGTTNMAPAMQRARLALQEATADRRHVILLSDGVSTPGDFDRIAREMAAAGITVSTVSVSQGADQTILRDIARTAGGRHYHCDDPREMPRILEAETRSTAQPSAAAAIRPMVYRALPGLDVAAAPELQGYVPTNPKPGAELLLLAPTGDPLLAWGRHGKGTVVTLAADMAGSPAAAWQAWAGYGPFLARLVRHVLPVREPAYRISTERQFEQLSITLDTENHQAAGVGRGATHDIELDTKRVGNDGVIPPTSKHSLHEVAPGRFEATIDSATPGIYELTLRAGVGTIQDSSPFEQRLAVAVDYPEELQLGPADEDLLSAVAAATGGQVLTDLQQGVPQDGRTVVRVVRLWPPLVMAAMLLFMIEIFLRRRTGDVPVARRVAATERPMGVP